MVPIAVARGSVEVLFSKQIPTQSSEHRVGAVGYFL